VSQATKEELDAVGSFHLVLRGEINMKVNCLNSNSFKSKSSTINFFSKGKGPMTTYWLEGEKVEQGKPST